MLVKFSLSNFLSFDETQTFSMLSNKSNKMKNHLVEINKYRILKSALVFGANASGKSNLIKAIDFAKKLIIRGDVSRLNVDDKCFRIKDENKKLPGIFQFDLEIDNRFYSYGVALSYYDHKILGEWLVDITTNKEVTIFSKEYDNGDYKIESDLKFSNSSEKNRFDVYLSDFTKDEMSNLIILKDLAKRTSDISSCDILRKVLDWFRKIVVVYPSTHNPAWGFQKASTNAKALQNLLSNLDTGIINTSIKEVDFDSILQDAPVKIKEKIRKDMSNIFSENKSSSVLFNANNNMYFLNYDKKKEVVVGKTLSFNHGNPTDLFELKDESDGTRRIFDLLPILSLKSKDTLILIDELDQSLHTKLAQLFYNMFMDQNKNKNQLIFTTHDILLMDLDLERQDEIWFLERGSNHSSVLYSLSDYKVRCDKKKISDDYLLGRYGALPILFQQVSEAILNE